MDVVNWQRPVWVQLWSIWRIIHHCIIDVHLHNRATFERAKVGEVTGEFEMIGFKTRFREMYCFWAVQLVEPKYKMENLSISHNWVWTCLQDFNVESEETIEITHAHLAPPVQQRSSEWRMTQRLDLGPFFLQKLRHWNPLQTLIPTRPLISLSGQNSVNCRLSKPPLRTSAPSLQWVLASSTNIPTTRVNWSKINRHGPHIFPETPVYDPNLFKSPFQPHLEPTLTLSETYK